jgi:hypothetical protein
MTRPPRVGTAFLLAALLPALGWAQAAGAPAGAEPDVSRAPAVAPSPQVVPASVVDIASWYPRTITGPNGTGVIHAPQIERWDGFDRLVGWTAFEITRTGSDRSYFGSLKFAASTDTDIAAREVLLHDVEVLDLTIDRLDEQAEEYALVREAFTAMSRKVPLDLVLAYLPHAIPLDDAGGLNTAPPRLFVAEGPALLLFVDGEPRFLPVEGTKLYFVLNTPWDILRDGQEGDVFLCHQGRWLRARSLDGPWDWARRLPSDVKSLPASADWDRIRACLPENPRKLQRPDAAVPEIYYSVEAAELLLFDGEPRWAAIGGNGLAYASNTDQEVFRVDGEYFVLLSGRWFKADALDGPWRLTAVLPDAFQDIPPADAQPPHPKSYVRVSVPGTVEAWEAALVASIPRKAQIQRGSEDALGIEVTYAGDPVFAPIEQTGVELAVNTSYQVLRHDGNYYLCHNATWLTASDPAGPWVFADSLPDAFADIPPTSPAYNTTFVTVEGSSDDIIDYMYTSGYENAYVSNGTVVQGTGYTAPVITMSFMYGYYGGYPYAYPPYYWWPPTYGYGAWYDPGTGRYGEAVVGYGPYAAAGGAAVYNPATGVYGRGQAVWDSDEFAGRGFVYNPNTDTSIARNRYVDFEDGEGWSQRVARRGDEWRYTESEWEDGHMVTEFESSRGTEGTVVRERDGDTVTSEGTVSRGEREASFESTRQWDGDAVLSEGTITGEDRSASFEGRREDGSYTGSFEGSEGGTGEISRDLDDGELSGSGSFTTSRGQTIDTEVTRTAEGVKREFETSGGGQGVRVRSGEDAGFVYESGGGDMYAGRDGNVYKRTDDGWSQVTNPGDRSAGRAEAGRQQPSTASRDTVPPGASSSFGGLDSAGFSGQSSLNRDYYSRQQGFSRYQQHRQRGQARPAMPRGRLRRR